MLHLHHLQVFREVQKGHGDPWGPVKNKTTKSKSQFLLITYRENQQLKYFILIYADRSCCLPLSDQH